MLYKEHVAGKKERVLTQCSCTSLSGAHLLKQVLAWRSIAAGMLRSKL